MEFDEIVKEQMKNVVEQEQVHSLEEYADQLSGGISGHFSFDSILDATLSGKSIFASQDMIDSLKALLLYEVKSALVIGVEILAVCIIIGLLKNLSGSFGRKSTGEIAALICSVVIIGLAMTSFQDIYQMTLDAVKTITYTMEILLPVLIAILIAMGQAVSGTIMSPLLLTAVTIFQAAIKNLVLPAVFLSTVFALLNCLTEKDYVNQLSKFLRQAALFLTGMLITLMTGIIAIQGLITKTSDSLIVGTAKYSLDAFIPIVGGFAADTAELFIKCMGAIKGVVGVFGILMILCLILTPIIKILVISLIYKVTALLIEPVASKKLAAGVADVGSCLIIMGSVLFFSSLLFIIFITSIITLGGGT